MKILDPGHKYLLDSFDGGDPILLTFVKRDDPPEKYPGNVGHYPGTLFQEVLRAMIDRAMYVQDQQPCEETFRFIKYLQLGFMELEDRVRRVRGQPAILWKFRPDTVPYCNVCGHVLCLDHEKSEKFGGTAEGEMAST